MSDAFGMFGGWRVVETIHMVDGPFEDWSQVRSPGRARRRRRKHPQRIRLYYRPKPSLMQTPDGTLYGHPATIAKLKVAIKERAHDDR